MKVILLERVGRMGQIGDEVTVRDGYARNFLLPQQKALRATEANRKRFERDREDIEKRNTERREQAAGVAEGLNGRTIVIIRQAGETGQLYGSVSARDIAEALSGDGFTVGRGQVSLSTPIKTVGMHVVALNLHAEVEVSINVNVARSEDEAARQAKGEDLTVPTFEDDAEEPLGAPGEGEDDLTSPDTDEAPAAEGMGAEMEAQRDA